MNTPQGRHSKGMPRPIPVPKDNQELTGYLTYIKGIVRQEMKRAGVPYEEDLFHDVILSLILHGVVAKFHARVETERDYLLTAQQVSAFLGIVPNALRQRLLRSRRRGHYFPMACDPDGTRSRVTCDLKTRAIYRLSDVIRWQSLYFPRDKITFQTGTQAIGPEATSLYWRRYLSRAVINTTRNALRARQRHPTYPWQKVYFRVTPSGVLVIQPTDLAGDPTGS